MACNKDKMVVYVCTYVWEEKLYRGDKEVVTYQEFTGLRVSHRCLGFPNTDPWHYFIDSCLLCNQLPGVSSGY